MNKKTNHLAYCALPVAGLLTIASSQATTVLLDDDLSGLTNFTNVTHGVSVWTSDGTDANFTTGTNGGNRASLRSGSFDLSPFVGMGETVILEFTTTISTISPDPDVNRFEVGLITTATVTNYDQPLAFETNVEGFSYTHTADFNPAGLFFNDAVGNRPGTGANDIMNTDAAAGTHTIRIEFSDAQTELFYDGNSIGVDTTNILDLNDSYTIAVFAQEPDASDRSFDNVTLTVTPEPSSTSLMLIALSGMLVRRKRR